MQVIRRLHGDVGGAILANTSVPPSSLLCDTGCHVAHNYPSSWINFFHVLRFLRESNRAQEKCSSFRVCWQRRHMGTLSSAESAWLVCAASGAGGNKKKAPSCPTWGNHSLPMQQAALVQKEEKRKERRGKEEMEYRPDSNKTDRARPAFPYLTISVWLGWRGECPMCHSQAAESQMGCAAKNAEKLASLCCRRR